MPESSTVSVVIPCYNAARFLPETIGSVLKQTVQPAEIILVDDGSTDDSAAIAEAFGPPVRVLRQPNQGESVARNRGMDEARGQWIAFLDADDRWEPTKLQQQVEIAASAPADVVCIYTDFYYFTGEQRLREVIRPEYHSRPNYRAYMLCLPDATIFPSCALVRTEPARAVRFPEETRHGEDMIFFAELRDHGPFIRIPAALAGYRTSPTNQTRARDHILRSVQSRFEWFLNHPGRFTPEEEALVRQLLAARLIEGHDMAMWARNNDIARACRALFTQIAPNEPLPASFRRTLYPRVLMRLKDLLDWALHPGREETRPS
jgi:glycosyltransferase involved in cell wall biosynthesis